MSDPVFMPFAFAGDWHGNTQWAVMVIRKIVEENPGVKVIYQLGDFGLFPTTDSKVYLFELSKVLEEFDLELRIVPGNHDDYARIALMKPDEDGWLKLSSKTYARMFFAPRGHVWTYAGLRFAALGGAGSIDRRVREEGKSWWPGEEITAADCQTLVDNVAAQGWDRLDFLLTHEAPAGPRLQSMFNERNRPRWFTAEVESDCWIQRVRLRNAVDQVKPKINMHGHWHYRSNNTIEGVDLQGNEYVSEVIGLACDGVAGNWWNPTADQLAVYDVLV